MLPLTGRLITLLRTVMNNAPDTYVNLYVRTLINLHRMRIRFLSVNDNRTCYFDASRSISNLLSINRRMVSRLLYVNDAILNLVIILLNARLVEDSRNTVKLGLMKDIMILRTNLLILNIIRTAILSRTIRPRLNTIPRCKRNLLRRLLILHMTPIYPRITNMPCINCRMIITPNARTIMR